MGFWGDFSTSWRDYSTPAPQPSPPTFSGWGDLRQLYEEQRRQERLAELEAGRRLGDEQWQEIQAATAPQPGKLGSFVSGLRSTLARTPELIGGAVAGAGKLLGAVNPRVAERHPGIAQALSFPGRAVEEMGATLEEMGARASAQEEQEAQQRYEEKGLTGEFWGDLRQNWKAAVPEYLGSTAGSLAGSMLTTAAGGMLPGSMALGVGEQYHRARAEGQERGESLAEAVPTGAVIGALERTGLEKIIGGRTASWVMPRLREGLAAMTTEGLTEGAQALVSDLGATTRRITQGDADPSALFDLFSPGNLKQYGAEAFLGGLAGGAASIALPGAGRQQVAPEIEPAALPATSTEFGTVEIAEPDVPREPVVRQPYRATTQEAQEAPRGVIPPPTIPEAVQEAAPVDTQPPLEQSQLRYVIGHKTSVVAPGVGDVDVQYAVVELGDLLPSHTDTLQKNPAYPQQMQPRARERKAYAAQIENIAANLDPRRLGENINASDGAPIIGADGVVESGNGRVLALRRAFAQHPERAAEYVSWLQQNAARFGVYPGAIQGLQSPVLVRVREGQVDREAFSRAANQGTVERMGAVEQAQADAEAMPAGILDMLQADEQGELNTAGNVRFLRDFFGAVTPGGFNAVTTDKGQVSVEGLNRARAAVMARAYSAPGLVEAMFEDPDSRLRRIGNGLLSAAPRYVRARGRMESGTLYPLDVATDLEQATRKLRELKSAGTKVEEYLPQQAMFGQDISSEAREFVRILGSGEISRSARRVNLFMQRYIDLAEGAGNPNQAMMFEGVAESPSKLDLIRRAEQEYEKGGVQEDLFAPAPGAIELATEGYVRNFRGPLGWLFGNRRAPLKAPRSDDVRSSIDEVEERWRNARGIKTVGMVERMVEGVKNAVRKAPRTWQTLDPNESPQHARTADALRRVTAAESAAASKAFDEIDYITRDLSPIEGELFTRMLVLPDVAKDAEAGLYQGKELPFGYPDAAAVEADLARFAAQATPAVQEALQRRQEIAETVANRLVDAKLLPEEILTDSRYYHRQVMAYMDGKGRLHEGRQGVRTTRRGFQRERVGGSDFNTRYAEAEFEWLADAYELLAKHQALQEMRSDLDIKPRLVEGAKAKGGKWQDQVPEGYTIWQPQPGNRFYRALTVTESQLEKFFEKLKQQGLFKGEELTELEAREALVLGGPKEQWVIPEDIAATLDQVGKTDTPDPLTRISRGMLGKWKQWTLINPLRLLKYNLNNMSGDLDIAIAADPAILKKMPKAFRAVWTYHMGRNPTPALRKYMNELQEMGVVDSGWNLQEVEDLGKDGMLRAFTEKRPGPLSRTVQRYWTNARAFTTARENLLRIAAYERAQELQAQGKEPTWASTSDQVRAIRDPKKRAAKLSRELVGDYGNISQAGRWMRANLMPFYSWMEINAPRYARLFKNAATEGGSTRRVAAARAGGAVARGAVNTTMLAGKAALLYAVVQLWNKTMFPDEDEELRKSRTRREPHLILGRTEDGEIRSIRFEGALGDALEWFDLKDLPADIRDVAAGDKTLAEMSAEAVKAPIERVATSLRPEFSTAMEVLGGRSLYPRTFEEGTSFKISPRPVYDKAGSIASTLSMTPVYEAATGKPQRRGSIRREFEEGGLAEGLKRLPASLARETVTYTTDPGEAAYWDTKSMVRDWLREQDKQQPTGFEKSKRGMALYYWKKAKQFGDERAEKKYRQQYLELGGTQRGMQQSIRMSGPLGGISKDDQSAFLRSLDPDERERLLDAQRWYGGVFR